MATRPAAGMHAWVGGSEASANHATIRSSTCQASPAANSKARPVGASTSRISRQLYITSRCLGQSVAFPNSSRSSGWYSAYSGGATSTCQRPPRAKKNTQLFLGRPSGNSHRTTAARTCLGFNGLDVVPGPCELKVHYRNRRCVLADDREPRRVKPVSGYRERDLVLARLCKTRRPGYRNGHLQRNTESVLLRQGSSHRFG